MKTRLYLGLAAALASSCLQNKHVSQTPYSLEQRVASNPASKEGFYLIPDPETPNKQIATNYLVTVKGVFPNKLLEKVVHAEGVTDGGDPVQLSFNMEYYPKNAPYKPSDEQVMQFTRMIVPGAKFIIPSSERINFLSREEYKLLSQNSGVATPGLGGTVGYYKK